METIWMHIIKNKPNAVNGIISNTARQLKNDVSFLIKDIHFELDKETKNDLTALAKDIEYYLGDKYV